MKFREQLENLKACADAVKWVGSKSAADAWRECERGDWMLWLLGRTAGPVDSADIVRKHYPKAPILGGGK